MLNQFRLKTFKNISKGIAYLGVIASIATILGLYIPLDGSLKDIISFIVFIPMMLWEVVLGRRLILNNLKTDAA